MLRQFKGRFILKSESLLDEFIWFNIEKLLNIYPLKRQYVINQKHRTDILGITKDNKLAVIRVKKEKCKGKH